MHDRLMLATETLDVRALRDHARRLGLDLERFDRDLGERTAFAHVLEDVRGAIASGINGVPTFYLDGVRQDEFGEPGEVLATIAGRLAGD